MNPKNNNRPPLFFRDHIGLKKIAPIKNRIQDKNIPEKRTASPIFSIIEKICMVPNEYVIIPVKSHKIVIAFILLFSEYCSIS